MPARSPNRLETRLFPANSLAKRALADNDELFPKAPTRHEPREPKGPGTRRGVIPLRPRGPMIAYMNVRACENGHGYHADKRTCMSCCGHQTPLMTGYRSPQQVRAPDGLHSILNRRSSAVRVRETSLFCSQHPAADHARPSRIGRVAAD
jgi:hypothetical protein